LTGDGKIFWGGGHNICLKIVKKLLFSSKKVEKHTILAGQGEAWPYIADAQIVLIVAF